MRIYTPDYIILIPHVPPHPPHKQMLLVLLYSSVKLVSTLGLGLINFIHALFTAYLLLFTNCDYTFNIFTQGKDEMIHS